jgi:hypothetical protein
MLIPKMEHASEVLRSMEEKGIWPQICFYSMQKFVLQMATLNLDLQFFMFAICSQSCSRFVRGSDGGRALRGSFVGTDPESYRFS